jgi:hypothetical protein
MKIFLIDALPAHVCRGAGGARVAGGAAPTNDDMTWLDHLIRALGAEFEKFEQLVALKFVELSLKFINSLVV